MSYLDLPRLHFGGAFFASPPTINNFPDNYLASTNPADLVRSWNPNGVSLTYLRGCKVTATVDKMGATTSFQQGGDPLFNGVVQTPSPYNRLLQELAGASYSLPKLVDLDPEMQFRSAVFGNWISVRLSGESGAPGFYAKMTVPFIRDLGLRRPPPPPSSYYMGCIWQGRLERVTWVGNISRSPRPPIGPIPAAAGNPPGRPRTLR